MINPKNLVPGDELQLSTDDLLLMIGRAQAQFELERSKNLALRQAFNLLREELTLRQKPVTLEGNGTEVSSSEQGDIQTSPVDIKP